MSKDCIWSCEAGHNTRGKTDAKPDACRVFEPMRGACKRDIKGTPTKVYEEPQRKHNGSLGAY